MISFPPCKINLGLNIIEKRSDGFHNLETCFYPIPFTDIVEILPSKEVTFVPTGASIPGSTVDNLCLQAYQLLKKDFDLLPVEIHLHKVIPTGAGLGGGSSDAAHTLRLLNTIFSLNLSAQQLQHYAQQLGSDCAFFIEDKPMLGTGRGEILSPVKLTLKGKFLVLVKPSVHVSTAEAYKGIKPYRSSQSIKSIIETIPMQEWKNFLKNDFEESIFKSYPVIREHKENLYAQGAVYAAMSGSGSSVFGIFDNPVVYKGSDFVWSGLLVH